MNGHTLILGDSGSGKSTMGKHLARGSLQAERAVFVCDPQRSIDWKKMKGIHLYADANKFLEVVKEEESATLIIDESGEALQKNPAMNWITTTARHRGHVSIIIAHQLQQLTTVLRNQCHRVILFTSPRTTMDMLWEEFSIDEPIPSRIPPYHFLLLTKSHYPRKGKVTLEGAEFLEDARPYEAGEGWTGSKCQTDTKKNRKISS